MSGLGGCGNNNSTAGTLTQMVATGAVDNTTTSNGSGAATFWKTKHTKTTNFALSTMFNQLNGAEFGGKVSAPMSRISDLVYSTWLVIDLPGITACEDDTMTACGTMNANASDANMCNPTQAADRAVYRTHIGSTESNDINGNRTNNTETGVMTDREVALASDDKARLGRARWLASNYNSCAPIDCCSPCDDCPDDCCENMLTQNNDATDGQLGQLGQMTTPIGAWCHWSNAIGQLLCNRVDVIVGGSIVDTLYADFLYMYEELAGEPGKRLLECIGKRFSRTQLVCDSRADRRLYVPLPLFYTQSSGQALALTSATFHSISLDITFEQLSNCIVTSSTATKVIKCRDGCCLTNSDLTAQLMYTGVFLDTTERNLFASASHETLVQQVQGKKVKGNSSTLTANLTFNNPVKWMCWSIRRKANEDANNWFNYSGIDGRDPIKTATLVLNNQTRFCGDAQYFRLCQPQQHFNVIPDTFVYAYSFALHPMDKENPSGSLNMSRIDSVEFSVELQDGLENESVSLIIFAVSWNIFKYSNGLAGMATSV
jgi:hypothetical protein